MDADWTCRVPLESLKSSRELLLAYDEVEKEYVLLEILFVEVV